MNDYAHLRLHQTAIRTRSPHPTRPPTRRRRTAIPRVPAVLTRLASGVKALASAAHT